MRYHIVGITRHAASLSSSLSTIASHSSICATRRALPLTLPRSFHTTPALYALIRSTTSRKREDLVALAQQDAKRGKLTAEKVAGLMLHPEIKPDHAVKIFDLAVKHKKANTDMCTAVLDYLKDKKQPELVQHVWNVIQEQQIPHGIIMLELVYELYAEATDTDNMSKIVEYLNVVRPGNTRFYNGIIEIFMIRNDKEKSFAMIEKMKASGSVPDSLSYGLILKVLDPVKDFELIIDTYKKMRADGIRPSGVTVFFMIEAYGKNAMYDKAVEMFDIGKGMGLRMTVNPYISVMKYLGKAGKVKRAYDTFDLILTDRIARGPICFHTMIEVFTSNNYPSDAVLLLNKMIKEGYKPTLGTFQIVLDKLFEKSISNEDENVKNEIVGQVNQVVEWMKAAKAKPDESLSTKFAEFETKNKVGPYWP